MAEEEEEAEDILADIRSLLQKEREEKENIYEITYPPEGSTKTITEGTTELNFLTGEVFLADGTEEFLTDTLQRRGLDYVRNLLIETSEKLDISLDDKSKYTIPAGGLLSLGTKKFQRLSLKATENTKIKVVASSTNIPPVFSFLPKYDKKVITLMDNKTIAASSSENSDSLELADITRFALTVRCTYDSGASTGITVYIYTYDDYNWDTDELTSFEPSFTLGTTKQKTAFIDIDAKKIRVKVTNKDTGKSVTGVYIRAIVTK